MQETKLELVDKACEAFKDSMGSCAICPRRCHADREGGELGYCRAPYEPVVYSYAPHHGEEPPLSGRAGSGTIFFSHCNMKCAYCQNYQFSQLDKGRKVSIAKLAGMMMELQRAGCHNINLVSPTHFVPQILTALKSALADGLRIPIVYNTSGYELADTLELLKGIIDIYLPDMRYSDNVMAKRYSDAPNYVENNRRCVELMQKQVGSLVLDDADLAVRGLIIRLLVLPERVSGTADTLSFIRHNIGKETYLSIMSQYHPTFKACTYKQIDRAITAEEYKNVVDEAHLLGLNNGWIQEAPEDFDSKFFGPNIPPKE